MQSSHKKTGKRTVWNGVVREDGKSLSIPYGWKKPRKVFVNSMSDLFHEMVSEEFILSVWQVMRETPRHSYQILTKRPDRMANLILGKVQDVLPNVWLGTSVENSQVVGRIESLRTVPAAIRFISFEPLIGPVGTVNLYGIRWAIVGGESGRLARPIREEWVDEIYSQCIDSRTAFFFKQWGTWGRDNRKRSKKANGREYRGRTWDEMPTVAPPGSSNTLGKERDRRTVVNKYFDWSNGIELEEHSRRKHKILREYFPKYLKVRCGRPQQQSFRLAIVDGFSGGGRYACGTPGSPLIFIEELKRTIEALNGDRSARGFSPIEVECLMIYNDINPDAVDLLKKHVTPLLLEIERTAPAIHVRAKYFCDQFEVAYRKIKEILTDGRYRNVMFNLDQSGHSHVDRSTIVDIMQSYPSAEIFYTFMIKSLMAFLQKTEPDRLQAQLGYLGLANGDLEVLDSVMNSRMWLGTAEKIVFKAFQDCARFVSPFAINNPNGWRYWLIHFGNNYRARQVYNDVLHDNSSMQAHFGRSGLHMLWYDPSHDEGSLYLFDPAGRELTKSQLMDDIPRLVSQAGDRIAVSDFYEGIYNITPAHTDDVHIAMIDHPDLVVVTEHGGARRKANTITVRDVLKRKTQRSFFPQFSLRNLEAEGNS